VQVADLLDAIQRKASFAFAEPGDNCGLLVGDRLAPALRVLAALDLTDDVVSEALTRRCDTVLTHHPLLFSPVRTLVEAEPRERLLRRLVRNDLTLIACHTNLDAAPGGLADIAGEALGLQDMVPLRPASAGWYKLVGFIPPQAVEAVAAAVFAAGAGTIGEYRECAFSAEGNGWFTPMPGSHPTVGEVSRPERTPELRWETVVPKRLITEAIRAFVAAHPYEEPAFDVYPVEDVLPRAGLGRVGVLAEAVRVKDLAQMAARVFESGAVRWSGDGDRLVRRAAVLPGSGRSLLETAAGQCEVLISGDLGYHAAEQGAEMGLSLIDVPHEDSERWAFRRWVLELASNLAGAGVSVSVAETWRSPWTALGTNDGRGCTKGGDANSLRIWIDGGSRGNPGPSAIGVVMEDEQGRVLETVSRVIGVETNNVAEYRALLTALELAARSGATQVEIMSDSELLVKQMRGEYKVRNQGLAPLYNEARRLTDMFQQFSLRHIGREENTRADALVNRALDELEKAGL